MTTRILHTMLRVGDLDRSVKFYTQALGMRLLRKFDNPEERYTLAFLGYQSEESSTVIELTYNYDVSSYEHGRAYGHLAIGVPDCKAFCSYVGRWGGTITRPPGPLKGGDEFIAFVEDPDGNSIEIIEKSLAWFV